MARISLFLLREVHVDILRAYESKDVWTPNFKNINIFSIFNFIRIMYPSQIL